jgi:outer membrane protein insertion porin family
VPIGSVQYFSTAFNFLKLQALPKNFTLAFKAEAEYGNKLGSTTALPPYKMFYGGGPDTVRGYKESYLGPRDNYGNPAGGNLLTVSNLELIFPTPEKWKANVRVSAFYDIGNVFSTSNQKYLGADRLTPVTYKFSFSALRRSTGLAVQWLAPMGIFRFSYAIPLNTQAGTGIIYADQREGFQFSIGSAF